LLETQQQNKDMKRIIFGLIGIVMLALLVTFGVTFASSYSVVLMTRELRSQQSTLTSQPTLTNNDHTTARTAVASLVNFKDALNITSSSNTRRSLSIAEEDIRSHRRKLIDDEGNGISSSPTLREMGTTPSSIVSEVCNLIDEGYTQVAFPSPLLGWGQYSILATIHPSSVIGCHNLSSSFGFQFDFSFADASGFVRQIHQDCQGPVTSTSTCTLYQVIVFFDAPTIVISQNTQGPIDTTYRRLLQTSTTFEIDRLLGEFTIPMTKAPFDIRQRRNIINACSSSSSLTDIAQRTLCVCQQSAMCLVPWGRTFNNAYYTGGGNSPTSLAANWNNRMQGQSSAEWLAKDVFTLPYLVCTHSQSYYTIPLNPDATIGSNGAAIPWTGDVVTDVIAITDSCGNSMQMLQWYFFWSQYIYQGNGDPCAGSFSNPLTFSDGSTWVFSSVCNVGQMIPTCRSLNYVTSFSCPLMVQPPVCQWSCCWYCMGICAAHRSCIAQEWNMIPLRASIVWNNVQEIALQAKGLPKAIMNDIKGLLLGEKTNQIAPPAPYDQEKAIFAWQLCQLGTLY
jgi:hypothetical protein